MKKLILILGSAFLVANILLGVILTAYPTFNVFLNSAVIMATTSLLLIVNCITLRDAFHISLSMIFVLCGFVELILGAFTPNTIYDNWYLVAFIFLTVSEFTLLAIVKHISKTIKN